jgi:hypothetical protein
VLDFDLAHWTDLAAGKGRLIAFFTPSTLPEDD